MKKMFQAIRHEDLQEVKAILEEARRNLVNRHTAAKKGYETGMKISL